MSIVEVEIQVAYSIGPRSDCQKYLPIVPMVGKA